MVDETLDKIPSFLLLLGRDILLEDAIASLSFRRVAVAMGEEESGFCKLIRILLFLFF